MSAQSLLSTRLNTGDLLRITADFAEQVRAGAWSHLLPPPGGWPTDDRWCRQLFVDHDVDVWAISWVPERFTELHDHGGSLGALTVVDGALAEWRWTGSGLHERRLETGSQAAFPLGWVHDVAHAAGDPVALSVHAYSPPLTVMSYYEVTEQQSPTSSELASSPSVARGRGPQLRKVRAELTDVPERPKRYT